MQWRGMGSAGRFRIASALLVLVAVAVVPGADAQDSAGDGFHVRVRCVGEVLGAVAFADADDEEREEAEDRAGQEHGYCENRHGESHCVTSPSSSLSSGRSQIATARYCTGPKLREVE